MTEHQLCDQLIELLNYSGCYCWRVNSGMIETKKGYRVRLNKAGTSDIQGIRKVDGRMICIEVKLPGKEKKLTQLQSDYLQKMSDYGALTGLATNDTEAVSIIQKGLI